METAQQFIKRKERKFKEEREKYLQKVKEGKRIPRYLFFKIDDIGRKGRMFFIREGWSFLIQENLPEKVFVIEKFRKAFYEGELAYPKSWKNEDIEYRIGYYIIGQIGDTEGTWRWGESCPIIPKKDLNKIIKKLKTK